MEKKTYPDTRLIKQLLERGMTCRCSWQAKGPRLTSIAWMEHYTVSNSKGIACIIIQTYEDGGCSVYVEAATNEINFVADDIEAAIEGRLT